MYIYDLINETEGPLYYYRYVAYLINMINNGNSCPKLHTLLTFSRETTVDVETLIGE